MQPRGKYFGLALAALRKDKIETGEIPDPVHIVPNRIKMNPEDWRVVAVRPSFELIANTQDIPLKQFFKWLIRVEMRKVAVNPLTATFLFLEVDRFGAVRSAAEKEDRPNIRVVPQAFGEIMCLVDHARFQRRTLKINKEWFRGSPK